jgi:hypothetical protein
MISQIKSYASHASRLADKFIYILEGYDGTYLVTGLRNGQAVSKTYRDVDFFEAIELAEKDNIHFPGFKQTESTRGRFLRNLISCLPTL